MPQFELFFVDLNRGYSFLYLKTSIENFELSHNNNKY